MNKYLRLLRTYQWYKNLLVFLPLVFAGLFLDGNLLFKTFLGFLSLCLVSSANYIVNDIIDVNKDRYHPEKKNRPIASGEIGIELAVFFGLICLLISFFTAYKIDLLFLIAPIFLFLFNLIYSLWLKNEIFVDILAISINFVVRAVSGIFIIHRNISPWLILCPFFLSLFIASGKRKADLDVLGEDAYKHKEVLRYYSKEVSNFLMIITTSLLTISYSLYVFLSNHHLLFISLPFAIYVIFRYSYLIYNGSEIARKPELFYKDKRLLIGIVLWVLMVLASLSPFSSNISRILL